MNLRIAIGQRRLADIAALGRCLLDDDVWRVCLCQRLARMRGLPARLLAWGHAQRGRLLRSIGGWRLAGVLAVLGRLPFELLDTQTQSFNFVCQNLNLPLQCFGFLVHGLERQVGGGVGVLHGFEFDITPHVLKFRRSEKSQKKVSRKLFFL
nr:hypothetical protein [Polaromonas glacialis]